MSKPLGLSEVPPVECNKYTVCIYDFKELKVHCVFLILWYVDRFMSCEMGLRKISLISKESSQYHLIDRLNDTFLLITRESDEGKVSQPYAGA